MIDYEKVINIAIDDFAKRKRFSYYTVIIDQDTHKIIEIVDSRQKDSVVVALKKYINVKTVTRDRSSCYKEAINEALPNALHIVDRFHLTKELAECCEKELKSFIKNDILYFNTETFELLDGKTIKKNKSTIRKYHQIVVDYMKFGYGFKKIFKLLKQDYNYNGCRDNVRDYCRYLRKNIIKDDVITIRRSSINKLFYGKSINKNKKKITISRTIDDLNITDLERSCLVKFIESNKKVSNLINLSEEFNNILYNRGNHESLETLLDKYEKSFFSEDIIRFITGIRRDQEYVKNAIGNKCNNGIAEGCVNLIKMIKRTMFGRCSFKLLAQKIFLFHFIPN